MKTFLYPLMALSFLVASCSGGDDFRRASETITAY
jgi:hypothetical protein